MKAAFYESDITPPLGCFQTGFGVKHLAEEVYDRLHAKALVIEQEGRYAVIISVDICEYPPQMHDIVTKRIYEYTGIPAESVCIHSTHCHWGAPVTDDPQIGCYGDKPYTDVFFRLVADSAILAYNRLAEATLSFASIDVPDIAHNRCWVLKDGTLKTHESNTELIERPLTEPDHGMSVVFIEQNGKNIGALYSFGCHQCTVHHKIHGYCADYSGMVSKLLKEKYGHDFVSIYLAAPSGDINSANPYVRPGYSVQYDEIGRKLSDAIISVSDKAVPVSGNLKVLKDKVTIQKRKYTNDEFLKLAQQMVFDGMAARLSNLVHYHKSDYENESDLYVQLITIGDFALYVYPGEMFVAYSHRTKEGSPFKYNMVAENSNAYGGYIPIPEAFAEGSKLYEIAPAYDSFLIPDAGEMLLAKAQELAKRIKTQ